MKFWLTLAIMWTILILVGCWVPISWLSAHKPDLLRPEKLLFGVPFDKLIHVTMFTGFAVLWWLATPPRWRLTAVLGGGILLTVVSEVGQGLGIVGREGDLPDGLADLLGLAVGLGATWAIARVLERLGEGARPRVDLPAAGADAAAP